MAINLLALEPHKVSRDLSGYITYIYGEPKTGKTTLASQMNGALLLAFEKGYNAIPGIIAQDITTWGELKQVIRELKKAEVQEKFKSVVIDTVDIAGALCEKYICSQNDVDSLTAIPYGQGWTKLKKEFEEAFRSITQLGYAVFFISHAKDKTFTRKDGTTYNQIIPTCANTYNDIAKSMADIYGYAEKYEDNGTAKVRLILRSIDNSADTGCRFKYIQPEIDFNYQALVKALNDAIDTEAQLTNNQFVTTEKNSAPIVIEYDYDTLMERFSSMVGKLMNDNMDFYAPRITQIVERYLGKGKKVSDSTRDQAEFIHLIVTDIENDLM